MNSSLLRSVRSKHCSKNAVGPKYSSYSMAFLKKVSRLGQLFMQDSKKLIGSIAHSKISCTKTYAQVLAALKFWRFMHSFCRVGALTSSMLCSMLVNSLMFSGKNTCCFSLSYPCMNRRTICFYVFVSIKATFVGLEPNMSMKLFTCFFWILLFPRFKTLTSSSNF